MLMYQLRQKGQTVIELEQENTLLKFKIMFAYRSWLLISLSKMSNKKIIHVKNTQKGFLNLKTKTLKKRFHYQVLRSPFKYGKFREKYQDILHWSETRCILPLANKEHNTYIKYVFGEYVLNQAKSFIDVQCTNTIEFTSL